MLLTRVFAGIVCAVFVQISSLWWLPCLAADKVTFEGLLDEMIDLGHLCEYPDPYFSNRQISSYDRMSQKSEQSNSWFANFDSGSPLYVGAIKERTPYYEIGPMQGYAPDGYFEKGTKVGISKKFQKFGSYVYAYATLPDGTPKDGVTPQGYIDGRKIEQDPQGAVLAEMKGPGSVVRIWCSQVVVTAKKINIVDEKLMSIEDLHEVGNLRVYIDGSPTPVIDCPLQSLMNGKWQLSDTAQKSKWIPIPKPLAQELNGGYSLYFPIPYAKSCKITCQVIPEDLSYHVEYRTYAPDANVESFSIERLQQSRKKIEAVAMSLGVKQPAIVAGGQTGLNQLIAPGKTATLALSGSDHAVVSLEAQASTKDDKQLRCLLLRGIFDGASTPQIECPLGDFFGTAPGINAVETVPLRVESSGAMKCYWTMPFRRSAQFEVQNLGTQPVTVTLKARAAPYKFTPRTMQFHAKWNDGWFPVRPFVDWNLVKVEGKGVLVGDSLSIYNQVIDWWGNGDEKIYVDKGRFPSHFGTATQDYFGFCSLSRKVRLHPYHSRTRADGPSNQGFTSLNRVRMLDVIPFKSSLKFDWEIWHCQPFSDIITYSGVAYWYGATDAKDRSGPIVQARLMRFPQYANAPALNDANLVEAEKLEIGTTSPGMKFSMQPMGMFPGATWSNTAQLWLKPQGAGEFAEIIFPCNAFGRYEVYTNFTKAPDYGIANFFINGKQVAGPIDFFNIARVTATGDYKLATVPLIKGSNKLRVEIVGCNGFSTGLKYLVGLDYIRLKRVGN